VHQRAALVLGPGKEYLVESKLAALARREGLPSVGALVAGLRAGRTPRLAQEVVEAMTVNETSWFRDTHPFDALRDVVLPDLVARRAASRSLTIWSAAASTGQEPYTLAMLLHDRFPALRDWKVRILATDLSADVLARAREGRYTQLEVRRGLPAPLLARHFRPDGPAHFRLDDDIRRMVEFRPLNLAGPWPAMPPVDVVLLRNVLIYFDVARKRDVLGRARRAMRPDGWLLLGTAETTANLDDGFERVTAGRATCYRPTAGKDTTHALR
jgi:chemotaxis protein methyltransferase CheR